MEKNEFPIDELTELRSGDLEQLHEGVTRLESVAKRPRAAVVK